MREAVVVTFAKGALSGLAVQRKGSGAVLLSAGGGRLTLRINGDSLLMLKTPAAMDLSYKVGFVPGSMHETGTDYLWLDEYGAVGSFVAAGPPGAKAGYEDLTATYSLQPQQVFWLSVGPPRPYDWEASFNDRVVWHWSHETGYPTDAQIEEWSHYGNMLLQQAEVMLWKDWSLRFIPRNGLAEFQRVNDTCRKYGMRNFVYTSPLYFLAGTDLEDKAMNSFDHFAETGFSPGDLRGLNWPIFLSEITKVMRDYKPQGLYFDGIYGNVVRTYLITRKAREVVGDKGILEFHATFSPPGGGVYLPQVDTYFNFVLRGEGVQYLYENPDYLRYFVSAYNISNSIGVLCNNNEFKLDEAFINKLLDNNIRLHFIPQWANDYRKAVFQDLYWPALKPSLEERVAQACAERSASAAHEWELMQTSAKEGTAGLKVAFAEDFASPDFKAAAPPPPNDRKPQISEPAKLEYAALPNGWRAYFSANSQGAMAAEDGVLEITAASHTCAYIERDLPDNVAAVQCKIKCAAGGGMSWGPGLMLRTPSTICRINVREEGRLGIDRANGQTLIEDYPAGVWYWVRLRIVGALPVLRGVERWCAVEAPRQRHRRAGRAEAAHRREDIQRRD